VRTHKRIKAIFSALKEVIVFLTSQESVLAHVPLSYNFEDVCSVVKSFPPSKKQIASAFLSIGKPIV
jgi:hypothetical protein